MALSVPKIGGSSVCSRVYVLLLLLLLLILLLYLFIIIIFRCAYDGLVPDSRCYITCGGSVMFVCPQIHFSTKMQCRPVFFHLNIDE